MNSIFRSKRNACIAIIPLLLAVMSLALSEQFNYVWTHLRLELSLVLLGAAWFTLLAYRSLRLNQSTQAEALLAREAAVSKVAMRTASLLAAASQVAVIVTDSQGKILTFSIGAQAIFGYTELEAQGLDSVSELLPVGQLEARLTAIHNDEVPLERDFRRKNGDAFVGELRHATAMDASKHQLEHLLIIVDQTERQLMLQDLQERKRFLKLLTQRIPNMLYQYHMAVGEDGYFSYCSEGIQRLFELEPSEVINQSYASSPLFKRVLPEDMAILSAATAESMQRGLQWQADFRVALPERGIRWLRGESYAERQPDGSFVWYGSCIDITEIKNTEALLRRQALTDELTGVYNRRHCMQCLHGLVDMAKRYGQPFSLILFDLDKFKSINDQWGHDIGDVVLRQSCNCIAQRLRATDILCRIGGEELVILCPQTSAESALQLARVLCEKLAAFSMPEVGTVTASFGVAAWRDEELGDAVLKRADAAAYRAKQNGRNCVEVD